MKDYTKLWESLKHSERVTVRLTFDDIEKLVGFKLGRGFIFDKLESVQYGYEAIDYSYKQQYVVFRKINPSEKDDEDTLVVMSTMGLL